MAMVTETLTVDGMSCQHCVHAVKTAVSAVAGVGTVEVSLEESGWHAHYRLMRELLTAPQPDRRVTLAGAVKEDAATVVVLAAIAVAIAGNRGEAIPDCWPARRMAQKRPTSITGKLGYYAMAGETSITPGTWEAASAAADVALTGAERLRGGARAAFALCRPPGHVRS